MILLMTMKKVQPLLYKHPDQLRNMLSPVEGIYPFHSPELERYLLSQFPFIYERHDKEIGVFRKRRTRDELDFSRPIPEEAWQQYMRRVDAFDAHMKRSGIPWNPVCRPVLHDHSQRDEELQSDELAAL